MSNNLFKGVVKLTQEQFDTLKDTGTLTVGNETITYSPNDTVYVVEDNITEQIAENTNKITVLQTDVSALESDVLSLQNSVQTNTTNLTELDMNKLDKNQGVSNAGKIMIIGDDGVIIPQTLVEGGTTVMVGGLPQTTWDADMKVDVSALSEVATSGSYIDLTNKPIIPTDNAELTNGAGYATTNELNSAVSGKLSSNQGTENAGKVMIVDDDGQIVPENIITLKKKSFVSYNDFYEFFQANTFEQFAIDMVSSAQNVSAYDEVTNLTSGEKNINAVELDVTKLNSSSSAASFQIEYTIRGSMLTVIFGTLYGQVSFDSEKIYISGSGSSISSVSQTSHLFSVNTTLDASTISSITMFYV